MSTLPEDPAQAPSSPVASDVPTDTLPAGEPTSAPTAPTEAAAATPAADTAQTAAQLAERFPALFKGAPKPLKLRIQADIQERAPGVFTKAQLSAFLRRYTGSTSYLIAVTRAPHRFDLDGQSGGELSDEHRKVAADELARRRAKRDARAEEELGARRWRAQLLRDHGQSKLTVANFCALKGIAVDQLDAMLAQARQEAEEDARAPRPGHGRGHGHGGPGRRDERGPRGEPRGPKSHRHPPREGRGPRGAGDGRDAPRSADGRPPRPARGGSGQGQGRGPKGAPGENGRKGPDTPSNQGGTGSTA